MTKRITSLILALLMLVTALSACSKPENGQTDTDVSQTQPAKITDDTSFKLSYTQSDSLDPFKSEAQNNQVLASLVFESLFDLDEAYELIPNIATDYEYTDSGAIRVQLDTNAKFSNGEKITADDVVYSVRAALDSPAYGTGLTGISDAYADGDSVIIELSYANPYAVKLLTFPIASMQDDENGFPIGSGRYRYESIDSKTVLKANTENGFSPYITTISLVNIVATDSIDNAINIGNISYAYRDLSSDISKRISSSKKAVNINNLVFAGVNCKYGITSDAHIRRAISLAADRSVLAQTAYSGYASPAASPFNPYFKELQDISIFEAQGNAVSAKQEISQSEYANESLSLTILVYKGNEAKTALATLLKSQLESAGFSVYIDAEYYSDYMSKIRNYDYDIYIGEVKLTDDMCLYPLLDSSGNAGWGIDFENCQCVEKYASYMTGDTELGKFILSFNEELPYIPLLYRKGMICYTKAMNGDMQGYYGNFFSNIESWNFSTE